MERMMIAPTPKRGRSTVAAAQVYNYLKALPAADLSGNAAKTIRDLEDYIQKVCSRTDSTSLLNILEDFGWNRVLQRFDNDGVDLRSLRIALSKRSLMLTTRASMLGPNLSPKSFAPAMLLSYLCNALNEVSPAVFASPAFANDSPVAMHLATTTASISTSFSVKHTVQVLPDEGIGASISTCPPEYPTTPTHNHTGSMADVEVHLQPASYFFPGVCLLVDISGFTRLSGNFCAMGKVGIDGLQQATNGYMGRLVEVIYKYGGDIIKFAGDAIICVFIDKKVRESIANGQGEGISSTPMAGTWTYSPSVSLLAVHCALELRDINTHALTVHVAVSAGEMCFGILGGYKDKWECLISGGCLMELSQCLDDAPSREVAITSALVEIIGCEAMAVFGAVRLESGNYRLASAADWATTAASSGPEGVAMAADEEELGAVDWVIQSSRPEYMKMVNMFVPSPVTLAFESGGLKYLAEIREVTVLFMKWDSYSTSAHQDLVSLQEPFWQCQALIAEVGGFIRQFLVDDKGCVLIACWGVPTSSYLNNAHRALSAAAKIRDAFRDMDLECSMGITTGNVYCGNVGSEIRREYAAVGDTVNLSARLMSKAHGGIYVDEATYSRLAVSVMPSFRELEPLLVKGKVKPLAAYSFKHDAKVPEINEPAIEEYEIKITCRTVLLRLLEDLLGSSKRKQSPQQPMQLVVLEGRVGSGKGTTVKWLVREAEAREVRVVRVSNLQQKDAFLDYAVVSKLFAAFIGQEAYDDNHTQRLIVSHILKEVFGSTAGDSIDKVALPAMRMAFGLTFPEISQSSSHKPSRKVEPLPAAPVKRKLPIRMVVDTVRDVLSFLINEQPTVVIVEDLHYCDEDSLKCLMALKDLCSNSMVLFTLLSADEAISLNSAMIRKNLSGPAVSRQGLQAAGASSRSHRAAAIEGLDMFRNIMSQHAQTAYIRLDDFNVTEIDAMIRAALCLQTVPLGLAQWVQQLSGGSIYWINEMLEFLKSTGTEEFMKITSFADYSSATPPAGKRGTQRKSNAGLPFSTVKTAITNNTMRQISMTRVISDPVSINVGNDAKKSQLEHFILCRFEKLPLDDQRILKSASVIGYDFSRYVLYGILSPALKGQLHAALKTLVKEKWITKAAESAGGAGLALTAAGVNSSHIVGGTEAEYIFCHPVAWETLYGLIPQGDRTHLHRSIAEYYENMTADEPALFERISSHFSHCDPTKAFEYAMKAAAYHLEADSQDLQRSLGLLVGSIGYCASVVEVDVLHAIVGTAQLIFYSDVDNIAIKRADGSVVRGGSSSDKPKAPPVRKASWRNKLGMLCCANNNAVKMSNNTVVPEPSCMVSRRACSQRLLQAAASAKSGSGGAAQVFSETGKEYMQEIFDYLDRQVAELRADLETRGEMGAMRKWHRHILDVDCSDDEDEYSWKCQSVASKASYSVRNPATVARQR